MKDPDPFSSSVGAFVLDTLTVGMYTDARDTIREYIQNALDGTRQGIAEGLITTAAGKISIRQSPALDRLTISDNGAGLPQVSAASTLLSIGKSSKRLGENAGFRGIGRLAGIAYCDTLVFETSHSGEDVRTIVVFDCVKLRNNFDPSKKGPARDLEAVMRESCTVSQAEEDKEAHFFRVTMETLKGDGKRFLEFDYLYDYLCQYAPVDYNAQKFMWASDVRAKIADGPFSVPVTQIELIDDQKKNHPIKKPYKGRYRIHGGNTLEIAGIEIFDDSSGNDRYWGWYGRSELLGSITEKDCAGLRIRVENILVGGSQLTEQFFSVDSASNARFNNWFVGEIFLKPGLVVPNGRRDGFEDTAAWRDIRAELEELAKMLSARVRSSSQDRNKSVTKIKSEVEKIISQTDRQIDQGFTSEEDRNSAVEKISRRLQRVETALRKERPKEEKTEIETLKARLEQKKGEVCKVKRFAVTNLQGVLSRKEMAVVRAVFDVLKRELDDKTYGRVKDKIEESLRPSKKSS